MYEPRKHSFDDVEVLRVLSEDTLEHSDIGLIEPSWDALETRLNSLVTYAGTENIELTLYPLKP